MNIKSFFIFLIILFVVYEIISVIIGVYKKKKASKIIESEEKDNVSSESEKQR